MYAHFQKAAKLSNNTVSGQKRQTDNCSSNDGPAASNKRDKKGKNPLALPRRGYQGIPTKPPAALSEAPQDAALETAKAVAQLLVPAPSWMQGNNNNKAPITNPQPLQDKHCSQPSMSMDAIQTNNIPSSSSCAASAAYAASAWAVSLSSTDHTLQDMLMAFDTPQMSDSVED